MTTTTPQETAFGVFHLPVSVSENRVRDLLCSAFEGGYSNMWAANAKLHFRPGVRRKDFEEGGKYAVPDWHGFPTYCLPFLEGCSVELLLSKEDLESINVTPRHITRETMMEGLRLMAEKYPRHFGNFISEDDDAITGDVFLQLVVLGDLIFG